MTEYNRKFLVDTLIYHHRVSNPDRCLCGWSKIGESFADHFANEYEKLVDMDRQGFDVVRTHGPNGTWVQNYVPRSETRCTCKQVILAADYSTGDMVFLSKIKNGMCHHANVLCHIVEVRND